MPRDAPLSSAHLVPVTEETKQRAMAIGIKPDALVQISEMGAQSLIAVHAGEGSDDTAITPDCFGAEYTPGNVFCDGCVVQPRCWRSDIGYLQRLGRGGDNPPPAVPAHVVASRVQWAQDDEDEVSVEHVPPEQVKALRGLEYNSRQIARMQPSTRAYIIHNQLPNRGVSITKTGEYREVGTAPTTLAESYAKVREVEAGPTNVTKRRGPPIASAGLDAW